MVSRLSRCAKENGAGLAGSLVLHLLLALFVVSVLMKPADEGARLLKFVPVDLVGFGDKTEAPNTDRPDLAPQISAPHTVKQEEASPRPETVGPRGTKAPQDTLDAKLKALARLRQPNTKLSIDDDSGLSNVTAGAGGGEGALYSVRDYVRAQVLRHWSLDLAKLGGRRLTVRLRISMKRNGTITAADIVEEPHGDALWHDIALSARNAALLSSPIVMPSGTYPAEMHFVLRLDPRETQH